MSDSVANRLKLSAALVNRSAYQEAVWEYETILRRPGGNDDRTRFKYAQILFPAGQGEDAVLDLDTLSLSNTVFEKDEQLLLRARLLDYLGHGAEAADIFKEVVGRLAGIEARCHSAAMLIEQGEDLKALAHLNEVERITRKWGMAQIGDDKAMIDWALRECKRIAG